MNLRQLCSRIASPAGALALLGIPLCIAAAYVAYAATFRAQVEEQRRHAAQRLEFLAISLESTLEKFEYLPFVVSIQRDARALVANPGDRKLQDELNVYLQILKEQSRVAAIYLMEERGTTLATSNWREPGSFLGQNYGFRPYFRDALGGRPGRFFAVGATTGEPGYFLSSPILDTGRRPIGVATVKVSLDEIEDAWKRGGERLVVADANGVIFLSSIPGLKYRTLTALDPAVLDELKRTRQYGPHNPTVAAPPKDSLEQSRPVARLGWRMITFSDLEGAKEVAWGAAAATGFAASFVLLLLFYLRLRASRHQELAAARAELQNLSVALEERIEERTAELVNANLRLQGKVSELKEATRILEVTQSDLVQAGKLAVLGQMAAGVTHELNQPLTAMRTLSDNAVKLLASGRSAETRENLEEIAQLTDRMGRIVAQLKTFSRKSKERWEPVIVGSALDKALLLVATRAQQSGVRVRREGEAAGAMVLGDDVRLEQVFVNLVRNAIDALGGREDPLITLRVDLEADGRKVAISVFDNGGGIPREVLDHLFEPFFTTKAAGEGLGLGLAISSVIVRTMGGELSAENRREGGAAFRVVLPRHLEAAYA